MRILLVNKFHYRKGGSETYYFDVAQGLKELGHEIAFFSMEDEKNVPCEQSSFFVSPVDYNGRSSVASKMKEGLSLVYSFEARRKFEALLQSFQPDVIHLNLTHRQLTFSILDAPSARDIPVVFTAHDYLLVCPNYLMLDGQGEVCDKCLDGHFGHCVRNCCVKGSRSKSALAAFEAWFLRKHGSYSKMDCIIAPSKFMQKKLLEGGFDPAQVVAIQNFASSSVMEQACSNTNLGSEHRERTILFAGRLSQEKGVDALVQAFLRITDDIPGEWRLVIAGDGPERAALELLLEDAHNAHRVNLVGFLDSEKMRKAAERTALASASSRCRENMPYSIIEAFAAGTPVIGSRIGGIPELVMEGDTGFLAEPDSVDDLARALRRAIDFATNSPVEYEQMQQQCKDYVINRCSQESYMKQLSDLYNELIERKRGTRA